MNYRSQREEAIGNKYQGERENNGGGGEEQEGRGVRDERREKGILRIIKIHLSNSVKFYFFN
jgi:hypothetical protein